VVRPLQNQQGLGPRRPGNDSGRCGLGAHLVPLPVHEQRAPARRVAATTPATSCWAKSTAMSGRSGGVGSGRPGGPGARPCPPAPTTEPDRPAAAPGSGQEGRRAPPGKIPRRPRAPRGRGRAAGRRQLPALVRRAAVPPQGKSHVDQGRLGVEVAQQAGGGQVLAATVAQGRVVSRTSSRGIVCNPGCRTARPRSHV